MKSNFRVKGKKFISGYYTLENFGYNLVYNKSYARKNPNAVNNCGLMLEFFDKLPENATVNVGCKFLEKDDINCKLTAMKYINFALLVEENSHYPVTYTIKQNGEKVIENTMLKGRDLTENQIKELYYSNYFREQPTQEEIDFYLDSLNKKRKLFHIEFKTGFNYYYGDLTILCNTWKNIGVSKFTLDRWDFENPFENEICIIRKSELVISKRSAK